MASTSSVNSQSLASLLGSNGDGSSDKTGKSGGAHHHHSGGGNVLQTLGADAGAVAGSAASLAASLLSSIS